MIINEIPYPIGVFFIIANSFCERFSFFGIKAVLSLYLKNALEYTESEATVVYHVFSMFCYFTPILGAIIADSLLGRYKTILYISMIYSVGCVLLTLAATPPVQLPPLSSSIVALALIAFGTGGIKPCISPFGGDQFTLPQQAHQLTSYFSLFYFFINAGSLLSTLLTPYLRKDIRCLGSDTCYPLAFGVPAALMIVSVLVFVIGRRWYTCKLPEGNVSVKVAKCIASALRNRYNSKEKLVHWLDHAENEYPSELIESIKTLLKVLVLYLPIPVFWALFMQQGSTWTFQASKMNGEVFGYHILPEQTQFLNSVLILPMIPLFDKVIYPAFGKIGWLKKPLQRITLGGVLAGVAFIFSGILEMQLEANYGVKLSSNQSHLNFINGLPCSVEMSMGNLTPVIQPYDQVILKQTEAGASGLNFSASDCNLYGDQFHVEARGGEARSFLISRDQDDKLSMLESSHRDILEKDEDGNSLIRFMFAWFDIKNESDVMIQVTRGSKPAPLWQLPLTLKEGEAKQKPVSVNGIPVADFDSGVYKVAPSEYFVKFMSSANSSENEVIGKISPGPGGNYIYTLTKDSNDNFKMSEYVIAPPNSVHMVWIIPQYAVLTMSEVMLSVTGLDFSFSEAPPSMKSVMTAAWMITVGLGNVIVIFISHLRIFEDRSKQFFLYAGLMFVDMLLFAVLAFRYKPAGKENQQEKDVEMKPECGVENDGYEHS